jgi:hypothetical protein
MDARETTIFTKLSEREKNIFLTMTKAQKRSWLKPTGSVVKKKKVHREPGFWTSDPCDPRYWQGYTRRYFCDNGENLKWPKGVLKDAEVIKADRVMVGEHTTHSRHVHNTHTHTPSHAPPSPLALLFAPSRQHMAPRSGPRSDPTLRAHFALAHTHTGGDPASGAAWGGYPGLQERIPGDRRCPRADQAVGRRHELHTAHWQDLIQLAGWWWWWGGASASLARKPQAASGKQQRARASGSGRCRRAHPRSALHAAMAQ